MPGPGRYNPSSSNLARELSIEDLHIKDLSNTNSIINYSGRIKNKRLSEQPLTMDELKKRIAISAVNKAVL